jgi:ribosomal-protein-alanine N-acetyltransferase
VEKEDAYAVHQFASNPKVKKYIGWQLKHDLEDTKVLIQTMLDREAARTHAYASVVESATDVVVGTVMFFNADWAAGHIELGYVLCESVWNRGYGTVLVRHLSRYALEALGFNKVYDRVTGVNVGSIRILEKNGYTVEAILNDYYYIDEEYSDCVILSFKG